jgi:hypothetical protein
MQISNGNPVYVWLDKTFRLAVMDIGNAIPRLVPSPDQGRFVIAVPTTDGRQVVAGTSDGKVVVFDAGTLREMYEVPGSGQSVASLDSSADSQQVMIANRQEVNVLTRRTSSEFSRLGMPGDSPAANLSTCSPADATRNVSTTDGGLTVQLAGGIATLAKGAISAESSTLPLGDPNAVTRDATISRDGRHVALIVEPKSDAKQKIMLVYDINSGQRVDRKQFEFGEGNQCVRMSPDEQHGVLVNDSLLQIVDFKSGTARPYSIDGGQNLHVLGVAFSPDGDRLVVYSSNGSLGLYDVASGMPVDQSGLQALQGDGPMSFGFDRSGKQVMILRPDQLYEWSVFPAYQDLVDAARADLPSCIASAERATLYLPAEPPDWCIELAKTPYDTDAWKDWLAAKKAGKALPMPGAAVPSQTPQ